MVPPTKLPTPSPARRGQSTRLGGEWDFRSTSGTFTDTITAGSGGVLAFTGTGFTGTIDVVSVKGNGAYIVQDVSNLTVGQVVQCSFQDSNLRRITAIDTTNKEIIVEGAPYMQSGHWLTAYRLSRRHLGNQQNQPCIV